MPNANAKAGATSEIEKVNHAHEANLADGANDANGLDIKAAGAGAMTVAVAEAEEMELSDGDSTRSSEVEADAEGQMLLDCTCTTHNTIYCCTALYSIALYSTA